MDFRSVQVLCMAVSTLIEEIPWDVYGSQQLHTPILRDETDCHNLELLMDIMGTLTRMLDTRIAFVTTDGKIVREWIESILEIGSRYQRELHALQQMEERMTARLHSE